MVPRACVPGVGEDGIELAVGHQRRVCRLVVPVLDHGLAIAVGHLLRDARRRRVLRGDDDLVAHAEHLEEGDRDGLRDRDLLERRAKVLVVGAEVGRRLPARVQDVGRLVSALRGGHPLVGPHVLVGEELRKGGRRRCALLGLPARCRACEEEEGRHGDQSYLVGVVGENLCRANERGVGVRQADAGGVCGIRLRQRVPQRVTLCSGSRGPASSACRQGHASVSVHAGG